MLKFVAKSWRTKYVRTHKNASISILLSIIYKGFFKPEKSLNSADGGWIAINITRLLLSTFRGGLEPHIFTQVKYSYDGTQSETKVERASQSAVFVIYRNRLAVKCLLISLVFMCDLAEHRATGLCL